MAAAFYNVSKHLNAGSGNDIGYILKLKTKTKIWLVGAVFRHRFGMRNALERTRDFNIRCFLHQFNNKLFEDIQKLILR
ncbi:hypothetical protein D3C86_1648490 [compost metagenome]